MLRKYWISGYWLAGVPALLMAATLAGCDKTPNSSPSADNAAPADVARESDLKAREEELARREADLAAKEREEALARREAEVAAKEHEQRLARETAAADAAAKSAAAAAAARKAANKASTRRPELASSTKPPTATMPVKPVEQRVTVPSGTPLSVALSSDLSSKNARVGDAFEATLASNVVVDGQVALPVGTRVSGTITDVISGSNAIGSVPTLGLSFNQLKLEDGQVIPISGELMEQGASEKVRDTAKILGGAAAGAVLGHQVKRGSGGKVIGGLLGGAIGAVAAKKTGTEVELAAGSTLMLNTGEGFTVRCTMRPRGSFGISVR